MQLPGGRPGLKLVRSGEIELSESCTIDNQSRASDQGLLPRSSNIIQAIEDQSRVFFGFWDVANFTRFECALNVLWFRGRNCRGKDSKILILIVGIVGSYPFCFLT